MLKENQMVKVLDLREMNGEYDFQELRSYIGRTGIVQFVDADQGEASVEFMDHFHPEHNNAEPINWFPINQLRVITSEDFRNDTV